MALTASSTDVSPQVMGPAAAIRGIAGGEAQAWTWIVVHEGPAMFRVAARLLGSAAAADDACQEAFLHLRAGARRFSPPSSGDQDAAARAWLLRVVANAAAMWARSERRRLRRERHVGSPSESSAPQREAGDAVERLHQALAALPDDLRLPVVLHHLGGQDYEAVGAALGISPGAARVRVHRALGHLRQRLVGVATLAGVAVALGRLSASEATLPVDALGRWASLATSATTPAAPAAAIFGGMTIMTKLGIVCAALAATGVLAITTRTMPAEERQPAPVVKDEPAPSPGKEGHDAMAEGTKGTSEGTILSKEKGKLVLRTADGDVLFAAHWRGGAPKDGGGLDAAMLKRLEEFKVGQRVRIAWTWSERRRIETIE